MRLFSAHGPFAHEYRCIFFSQHCHHFAGVRIYCVLEKTHRDLSNFGFASCFKSAICKVNASIAFRNRNYPISFIVPLVSTIAQ